MGNLRNTGTLEIKHKLADPGYCIENEHKKTWKGNKNNADWLGNLGSQKWQGINSLNFLFTSYIPDLEP